MNTTTMNSFHTHRTSRWYQFGQRITEWQRSSRSCHELENLSDATLRDIGITRCEAHREINKSSWMA